MKVVGVGLNKTGTTSLGVCLKYWGLKHLSCTPEAFELWRRNKIRPLMTWVARYDSFEDWPWPLLYREIDRVFPGTKFILTRRKDPNTWFGSLCRHAERTGPTAFRKYIYGHAMPRGFRDAHIRFYEAHNEAVRKYFERRPNDFLEVCWEEGDGWEELAEFLGFETPNRPFPHANQSPTHRGSLQQKLTRIRHRLMAP